MLKQWVEGHQEEKWIRTYSNDHTTIVFIIYQRGYVIILFCLNEKTISFFFLINTQKIVIKDNLNYHGSTTLVLIPIPSL